MKLLLGILFLSLSLLSGCQQQQKTETEYERGYVDGQKTMINQFWEKLNAEADLWESWQVEAENSLNEAQKLKKWGIFTAIGGFSIFLMALFLSNSVIKNSQIRKKENEEETNKLKILKDEALRTIELSKSSRKEFENSKKEMSELQNQMTTLKKDIETLILAKAKAEQDYQIVQKKLDEISI